jgi:hopanoid-associated phosphorylase
LVVVGLEREARIVGGRARVSIGGRGLDRALTEGVSAVLSFGLCGGLNPALGVGDLVLGEAVVTASGRYAADPAWIDHLTRILPRAARMAIAAGPNIVGSAEAKATLRQATGAGAVDMESHLVAEAASRAGVPFAVLRAVSDRAEDSLPAAAQAGFADDGRPNVGAVLAALLARPGDLTPLIRTAFHAEAAFKALKSVDLTRASAPFASD